MSRIPAITPDYLKSQIVDVHYLRRSAIEQMFASRAAVLAAEAQAALVEKQIELGRVIGHGCIEGSDESVEKTVQLLKKLTDKEISVMYSIFSAELAVRRLDCALRGSQ